MFVVGVGIDLLVTGRRLRWVMGAARTVRERNAADEEHFIDFKGNNSQSILWLVTNFTSTTIIRVS